MSCNYRLRVSQPAGHTCGLPDMEAGWSAERNGENACPQVLPGEEGSPPASLVLHVAGRGMTQADGLVYLQDRCSKLRASVPPIPESDADLWFAPLACGHSLRTNVRPGGREWCTACDDFSEVVWCVQGQTAFYRREADDILLQLNRSPITDEEMARLETTLTLSGQPGQDIMTYVHLVVYWREEEKAQFLTKSRKHEL